MSHASAPFARGREAIVGWEPSVTPLYHSQGLEPIGRAQTLRYRGCVKFTAEEMRNVRAALGWLELGDHVSALEELEALPGEKQSHPHVLKIRYAIHIQARRWDFAFELADGLSRLTPDEVQPFVWRSYAARRMPNGSTEMALQLLLDVANHFPDEPIVPFNLACYNCQLGKLVQARSWLHIAFEVAAKQNATLEWKRRAIDDKDLQPLRDEVRNSG